jgi:hypothetical protein
LGSLALWSLTLLRRGRILRHAVLKHQNGAKAGQYHPAHFF